MNTEHFGVWRARRGAASVELAILLPVLIVILTALADLTGATLTWWQAAQAADAIGRIATSLAVTSANTNLLSQDQARIASTAALALLPSLRSSHAAQTGVVLSSVVFTPIVAGCKSNCTYTANVAWSASLQGGLPARPCGRLSPAANTAPPTPTTLAASAYSASSLLVVDVAAEFTPVVTTLLGPVLDLRVAALMAARAGAPSDWIRLTGPTSALQQCPGYT